MSDALIDIVEIVKIPNRLGILLYALQTMFFADPIYKNNDVKITIADSETHGSDAEPEIVES